MSTEETPLQWGKREFDVIADDLVGSGFSRLSQTHLVRDQQPPGERRIDVGFFGDPQNPHVRVVNQPKEGLLPSLAGIEPEAPEAIFFDAVRLGSEFGWIERSGHEGSVSNQTLSERIRRLFELA
jgi:hypothetical protein